VEVYGLLALALYACVAWTGASLLLPLPFTPSGCFHFSVATSPLKNNCPPLVVWNAEEGNEAWAVKRNVQDRSVCCCPWAAVAFIVRTIHASPPLIRKSFFL
jgi:hypothetical protein